MYPKVQSDGTTLARILGCLPASSFVASQLTSGEAISYCFYCIYFCLDYNDLLVVIIILAVSVTFILAISAVLLQSLFTFLLNRIF